MTHALKCWPEYYESVAAGLKNFELRRYDRPFHVGDTVLLQEFDPKMELYTGKEIGFEIGYILQDAQKFGLKPGFCILGLLAKEIEKPKE